LEIGSTWESHVKDIFISHTEEDADVAFAVAHGIELAGYSTWYYERDGVPGPAYLAQVGEAIERARAVVLVISPDSLGSSQVTNEVVRAYESGRPFLPVLRNITHAEFQQRQPVWRQALGASTSISIPPEGVPGIVERVIAGLRALGIQPGAQPTDVSDATQAGSPLPPGATTAVADRPRSAHRYPRQGLSRPLLATLGVVLLAATGWFWHSRATREAAVPHREMAQAAGTNSSGMGRRPGENNAGAASQAEGDRPSNQTHGPGTEPRTGRGPQGGRDVPALVFSEIEVEIPYGYAMTATSTERPGEHYWVYAQPVSQVEGTPNPHSQDIVLDFDVTSRSQLEARIVAIYVDVRSYHAVQIEELSPLESAGETRRYFCSIMPKPGSYECRELSGEYDFIKLSPGELEHIGISTNTAAEGVYELGVSLIYSLGGKRERVQVGELTQPVGFFKHERVR
jgi:hypothetical protein